MDQLELLTARVKITSTRSLLTSMIHEEFPGKIALVSSFGTESAILLHLVSEIDKTLPIIFLNTGKLFGETLKYRDSLVSLLGLYNVRSVEPDPEKVEAIDSDGVLWYQNPGMCCYIRKVEPLNRALAGFDAWITGRKAYQGGERANLPQLEKGEDGRIKVNPLAEWKKEDLDSYFWEYNLPRHPLEAEGFLSIGCMPCTDWVRPGEDMRAGRWRDSEKTECGIHLPMPKKWKIEGGI